MSRARPYGESAELERPPAFQEYAAAALSAESVQLMGLQERGLLFTMRLYCWVNQSIPKDPGMMARALGLHADEVRENLTGRVLGFFEPAEDDRERLVCPALVRQMVRLMDRREKQARAAADTNKKRRDKRNPIDANRGANRGGKHDGLEKSRTEPSTTALCKGSNEITPEHRQFVQDMERAV